jgi:hypothetical protein
MATLLDSDVLNDSLAKSMAHAVAIANRRANELGIDVKDRLISAAQRSSGPSLVWEISYIPKDYVGRRGGDFTIEVDPVDGSIRHELRGQ